MNNNDRFELALRRDPLEAAALAIQFGANKGSNAGAWAWAKEAVRAAAEAGITLDCGTLSWPEWDLMETQLKGK